MHLDSTRDYRNITKSERQIYEEILAKGNTERKFGRINHYNQYPEAVKNFLSLFPNNHICLYDLKRKNDLHSINLEFQKLIHDEATTEQDILRFINHNPKAFHIIGSIFSAGGFTFGHHSAFLFPEFRLGNEYRADYLLIGSSSGGYEFIFIELEKSNGRVVLKDGHLGKVLRDGENQIVNWKKWIEGNFHTLQEFFNEEKSPQKPLPKEFCCFDNTRIHYVVVGGTREHYSEEMYRHRRSKLLESNIKMLHYDNLFDYSEELLERKTF